ncbi:MULTISPECIES: class I adenylate-forming enzyme family protein [Prauserella salsuginis group]|nr:MULTISPECIES: AMP-binding protein [Prauserella salsuginis group]
METSSQQVPVPRTVPAGRGAAGSPGWAEAVPIGDVVVRAAALWPDSEALVFPGERLTFAELAADAELAARALRAMGVGPGDHVGILMANCADFARVSYGATMLGAVAVLINARYQGDDLAHVLGDADVKVLVSACHAGQPFGLTDRIEAAMPELDPRRRDAFPVPSVPTLEAVVVLGDGECGPAYLRREGFYTGAEHITPEEVHALRRQVSLREVGMMMYTSGTTAQPKGCALSHEMVVRNAIAVADRLDVHGGDRFWDPLPMFHMSSVLPMNGCFYTGATFLSMEHFEPDGAIAMLRSARLTHFYPTFPTITQALADHPEFSAVDWSAVRVINGVAPPATLRELQKLWPHAAVVTAYGSTETGGCVSFSVPTDTLEQRTNTSGPPFPGIQVRVVDAETGVPVPTGERGEICVRGYSMFEGYRNDPEATAAVIDDEGWFHTGDIGTVDADGRISYLGRLKDMLKVGGENVAAVEIEEALQRHPAVGIAQVVGIPDDRLVEVPVAAVELRDGHEITGEELREWLHGRIASFKLPRYVRVVDEWPMAATKIQKFRLREALCAELGIDLP